MSARTKVVLLFLPLALALSILIDTPFHALWGSNLLGVYSASVRPSISVGSFWRAKFQPELEAWFEQQLASKAVMVRTDNTISLLVFREISAHSGSTIVLGKHHTLFELSYINNRNGVSEFKGDLPPKSPYSVAESTRRMARAARAFRLLGIDFMIVFYPSKAAVLSQRLRSSYVLPGGVEKSEAGYQQLLDELRAGGVPVVDGAGLFSEIARETPNFPLYNSGGLHWTDAGACQVARLMLQQMPLANVARSDLRCRLGAGSTAEGGDADLAELSNLWDHSRFLDQIPSLTPSLSRRLSGGPRDALIVGTSFSEHFSRELHQAGAFRNVKRVLYYRHSNVADLQWEREVLRPVVIFEQWQWSYLTVNLTEFLADLVANSARFADAYRQADSEIASPPR